MAKTIPQLTDATTVNAADELIIQQGGITKRATGAELAKGLNTINGTVNVKDFGAVGDGVTDDTTAITAWVAQLNSSGAIGYLPPGNFVVDAGTIVLTKSGCGIVGSGSGNNGNLQASGNYTAAATTVTIKGAGAGIRVQGQSVLLKHFHITSDTTRAALSFAITNPGIRIEPEDASGKRADRAVLQHLRVDRHPGDGVLQVGPCTYSSYEHVDVYECKGFGWRLDDGSFTGIVRTNKHYPGLNTLNACRAGFCGGHGLAASNASVTTQFGMAVRLKLYDWDSFGNGSDTGIMYAAGDANPYDVWIFGENCVIEKSAVSGLQGPSLTVEQLGGIYIAGRDNEINNCRFIETKQPVYFGHASAQPSSGLDVRKFRLYNSNLTIAAVVGIESNDSKGVRVWHDRSGTGNFATGGTAGETFTRAVTNRLSGVATSSVVYYQNTANHLVATLSSTQQFTIADDSVKKITINEASVSVVASGVLIISPTAASGGGGIFHCRVGSASPATHKWAGDATSVVGPSTGNGALTGTTGVDGEFTVSCDSTGIFLENRRGFLATINVALVGFPQFASAGAVA